MRVRAKDIGQPYSGYYGHRRREPGEEFVLEPIKRIRKDAKTGVSKEVLIMPDQQFSERWMEKVDKDPIRPAKEEKKVSETEPEPSEEQAQI